MRHRIFDWPLIWHFSVRQNYTESRTSLEQNEFSRWSLRWTFFLIFHSHQRRFENNLTVCSIFSIFVKIYLRWVRRYYFTYILRNRKLVINLVINFIFLYWFFNYPHEKGINRTRKLLWEILEVQYLYAKLILRIIFHF